MPKKQILNFTEATVELEKQMKQKPRKKTGSINDIINFYYKSIISSF